MANATHPTATSTSAMLQRIQTLIALLLQYLGDPARTADFDRLCAEVERLLARCIFEAAARLAGRTDLLATHEAIIVWKGASFHIHVRAKLAALPPLQRAFINAHTARRMRRYRLVTSTRNRHSRKISTIRARNQRRQNTTARRISAHQLREHAQARVLAPP